MARGGPRDWGTPKPRLVWRSGHILWPTGRWFVLGSGRDPRFHASIKWADDKAGGKP